MSEHTKRTVETEFTAKDAGYTATLSRITSAFQSGWHKLEHGREKLADIRKEQGLTMLATFGVGVGIGSWIEKIKEANAEFHDTKVGVAGILSDSLAFKKGTSETERYIRSLSLANDITNELDETSARFGRPMADVAAAYRSVTVATGPLGLAQEQVMEMTQEATAMAKRFGVSGEQAATAIARALQTGSVRGFDPFDQRLRMVLGNMQKLSQAQRFVHIEKALKGSMDIAEDMAGGIGGSIARIQNTVEDFLRDSTQPLFEEIAQSLHKWAKYLREAKENGKPLIDMFADKLVKAFHTLQDITGFIADHWKSIAATYAMIKAGGLLTSAAGGLGGLAGGLGGAGLTGLAGGVGGLGNLLGVAGRLAPALGGIVGAAALAAIALHGVYEEWQGRKKQAADLGGFFDEMGKVTQTQQYLQKHNAGLSPDQIEAGKQYAAVHTAAAQAILKQKGLWEGNSIAMEKFGGVMDAMADDVRNAFAKKLGLAGLGDVSSGMLGAAAAEVFSKHQIIARQAVTGETNDKNLKFAKQINNFNGGIHITQKFEEQDPDRVFVRFKQGFENEISSRTQSIAAEPEGF